jgi:glycosyltransferase involved in cell wall biosynthesis
VRRSGAPRSEPAPATTGEHGGGPAGELPLPPCAVTIVAHDVGSVGGMERQLAELVLGLRARGHEVHVIAWTCELPEDAGVVFHRVRGPRRPFLLGYPCFMIAGSLVLHRHRLGIVQATGAIVLNRLDSVAVHCCHQVYREAPRRSSPPFRAYTALMGFVKRQAERWCLRANRPAAIVCVSEGVAEEMREHYPRAAERVLTIQNGVDTEAFAPGVHAEQALALRQELAIAPERLVAAFVARGWGHKGLGAVIEALPLAPAWDLVVAGSGDQQSYGALASSRGVAEAVHWLGVRRDIGVVYELADVFVLPSSYETFSLVAFEAAASGVPVLATPVSGIRELLSDGESGFFITRDPDAIARRLNELAADPELRARIGARARESALNFTWDSMVDRHAELYARLSRGAPRVSGSPPR